jgi:3,4-dihydroxy-2-butanone 4-phosphate synthase
MASGGKVILVDDDGSADLVMSAESVTPRDIAFYLLHTSGLICVALPESRADTLKLTEMVPGGSPAFTISVDALHGCTTGISADDRSTTIAALVDPRTRPQDLARPGHVFPIRCNTGGVLRSPTRGEGSFDLARLAGCQPAGVFAGLLSTDKISPADPAELQELSAAEKMPIVSIAQLAHHRLRNEKVIRRTSQARIPTRSSSFSASSFKSVLSGDDHVVLTLGDVSGHEDVLVRFHPECLAGDVFGSNRCTCGEDLRVSLECIAAIGRGALVYLRGSAGRGLRFAHGFTGNPPASSATGYGIGAQILKDLGIANLRLITTDTDEGKELEDFDLKVSSRVPLEVLAESDQVQRFRMRRSEIASNLSELDVGF